MDISSLQEIQHNELVRKRPAKKIVRDCFRDGEFEKFHSRLAELDNDTSKRLNLGAHGRAERYTVRYPGLLPRRQVPGQFALPAPPAEDDKVVSTEPLFDLADMQPPQMKPPFPQKP